MGLKARVTRDMLKEYSTQCIAELNEKIKADITWEFNWSTVPDDVSDWGWSDDLLKTCFYNSYFIPLKDTFLGLIEENKVYEEEIAKQIKKIIVEPGRKNSVDYDFSDGVFFIKHTMNINQKTVDSFFIDNVKANIKKVINEKLS